MKRILSLALAGIMMILLLSSCASSTPSDDMTPPSNSMSEAEYCNLFRTHYYASFEGMFQAMKDFPKDELEDIHYRENLYIEDTRKNTFVSEDELKNGIFGNMRTKLLEEETFLVPYYKGEIVPLDAKNEQNISMIEAGSYRKPRITYNGIIDIGFWMTYIDSPLVDEANEKGASWLIKEIDPNGTNVDNYQEKNKIAVENGIKALENTTVYEKKYILDDREILALVFDNTEGTNYPLLTLHFVYDDLLISVFGRPEIVEALLPDLTFREVHLPTGKATREEPGREWSKWSNAKGVDVEDVKQDDVKNDLKQDNSLEAAE